jgi:hypothetical protein
MDAGMSPMRAPQSDIGTRISLMRAPQSDMDAFTSPMRAPHRDVNARASRTHAPQGDVDAMTGETALRDVTAGACAEWGRSGPPATNAAGSAS